MLEAAMVNISEAFDLLQAEIAGGMAALRAAGSESFRSGPALEPGQWATRLALLGRMVTQVETLRTDTLECLRPLADKASAEGEKPPRSDGSNAAAESPGAATLIMTYDGVRAWAAEDRGQIVLLNGSTVKRETWGSLAKSKTLLRLRKEGLRDGTLVPTGDPRMLELTRDLRFSSRSAAAGFVAGCSVSGNREWTQAAGWRTGGSLDRHPGLMN